MAGERIYPKATERVANFAEEVAGAATYNGLATGILKGLHAAKNSGKSVCIDNKPLNNCDGATQAIQSTMELISEDTNDGFTGWVGYERAKVTCEDCSHGCSARVLWKDGKPTEQVKFLFYELLKPDTAIHIDNEGNRF